VARVAANPALDVIASMSLDEKFEVLQRLQTGEFVAAETPLPLVEAAPPTD
jgi:hypothetical protein